MAPTALGGSQGIRFFDARGDARALVTHTVDIDESIIGLSSRQHGSAELQGRATGSTYLRVVDLEGQLLDRLRVSVVTLASVRAAAPLYTTSTRPIAYTPGPHAVHVGLFGATGERLVDESLRFDTALTTASFTVSAWDTIQLEMPTTSVTVAGTTAAGPFTFQVQAAGPIDDIAVNFEFARLFGAPAEEPLTVERDGVICFEQLSGGATVISAPHTLHFRVDGVDIAEEADPSTPCLPIPDRVASSTTIEVTAGEVTRTFNARVVD